MARVYSYAERTAQLQALAARLQALIKANAALGADIDGRRVQLDSEEDIVVDAADALTGLADEAAALSDDLADINWTHQWRIDARRPHGRSGLSTNVDNDGATGHVFADNDFPAGFAPDDWSTYVLAGDVVLLADMSAANDGVKDVSSVGGGSVTFTANLDGTDVAVDEDAYLVLHDR